jgi:hypothetical protein
VMLSLFMGDNNIEYHNSSLAERKIIGWEKTSEVW